MWLTHWAVDQRSGPALKFHWASESPLVASRTPCFVFSRYWIARSFSAWVTSCARTAVAPAHASMAIAAAALSCLIMFGSLSFWLWEERRKRVGPQREPARAAGEAEKLEERPSV